MAHVIHRKSTRSDKPFLCANCAAFEGILLESELFGHEPGAFVGAERGRIGLFEAAHEGTLLLDEVAETSPVVQAKLVRFLGEGEIQHLGSAQMRPVNVRVLATTRRDLGQLVKDGRFREDLYYQLMAVPIAIPPLRDRSGDLEALCDFFLGKVASELNLPQRRLSAQAVLRLRSYDFPGNVRELRNLIERAMILSSQEEISAEYFPVRDAQDQCWWARTTGMKVLFNSVGLKVCRRALTCAICFRLWRKLLSRGRCNLTQGAQAEAARRLGLSRSDLSYKLLKYQLRKESTAAS